MDEIAMRELAAEYGYDVWLTYPNFVSMYQIVLLTGKIGTWDRRIQHIATLETVDQVITWLAEHGTIAT